MWRKLVENARKEFTLFGILFLIQIALCICLCWFKGQSSKEVALRAFDEEFRELVTSERTNKPTKQPSKSSNGKRYKTEARQMKKD